MASFNLYMAFPSDLESWWEVSILPIGEFTEPHIDEQPNTRFEWGELTIKNEPLNYKQTPSNRFKLYDLIMDEKPTAKIQIKFVSAQYPNGIFGYFGKTDLDIDDSAKYLKVKPSISDVYSPIIENRENEIKLFDEHNIVRNPMFNLVTGIVPDNWTIASLVDLKLERIFLDNNTAGALSDIAGISFDPLMSMSQSVAIISANQQLKFAFSYFLSGTSQRQKNLFVDVFITATASTTVYRLLSNGTWADSTIVTNSIAYDQNRTPIDLSSFNTYKKKSYITDKTPETGIIQIVFYRPTDSGSVDYDYKLILANIEVSAAEIELKTIKVNFSAENLVQKPQEDPIIQWTDKAKQSQLKYFSKYGINYQDGDDDFDNFIDPITGEPKSSMLNDADVCPTSYNNLTYGDLLNTFDSMPLHESYKFELSELTIYKGRSRGTGKHRDWYGTAKFSREEIYKIDTYELDGITLVPPVYDSGWAKTETFLPLGSQNRLWVRKPFNGIISTWEKGSVDGSVDLRRFDNSFDYYDKVTTIKVYPIDTTRSFEIDTAIELRELIRKVYAETHPDLKDKKVYSSFFWNDCEPLGALPDVTLQGQLGLVKSPGTNYANYNDQSVAYQPKNPLNNIVAVHTYELREANDQKIGDENSILKLSFKKLMDDLLVLFNYQIYFFVDSTYNLHIEHVKYFDRTNTPIDMSNPQFSYIKNYEAWKYDKSKMYSLQEFEVKNAGCTDFKTSRIVFNQLASNKRTEDIKATYSTQNISTDIQFCKENPTSIDNGIVFIAYDVVGVDNIARYGTGQKSGSIVLNGDLSISTLLERYGRYEGTWKEGKINDKTYVFENTKRSIQGKEITFKGILTENNIDNNIGRGLAMSKSIDFNTQLTKVVFNYRYVDYVSPTSTGAYIIVPTLASVITVLSAIISNTETSCSGNVTSDGNSPVTERGIYYGTDKTAITTAGSKVTSGTGIGVFTATLTGLSTGVVYYYRAYAINAIGTSYGEIKSFTNSVPSVTTSSTITDITDSSATCGGEVISTGGETVTERGICYSNYPLNITISGLHKSMGSGIGAFTGSLTGLIVGTYYIRAYATTATGTVYGIRKSFMTIA